MVSLFLIGRILFGGYFIMSGIKHFKHKDSMKGYAASKGVPFPEFAVLGSGLIMVLGGLGVVFWAYHTLALVLLLLFLVPVTMTMHAFWDVKDPQMRMAEEINFYKNIALAGAILMLL